MNMNKSWFLKWILALGIVIVMNLLFNYGLRTFYRPAPQYNEYCKEEQVNVIPETQESCVAVGGAWTTNPNFGKPIPGALDVSNRTIVNTKDASQGYCNINFTCNNQFSDATRDYNQKAFIVLVILGILAIVVSFFFAQYESVSLGLSFGGVVSVIVGSIRYWSDMDDKLRFVVLLIGFIALIWLGIKKIRD